MVNDIEDVGTKAADCRMPARNEELAR